jgi:hypothetical protein
MSERPESHSEEDILEEYDFTGGVRGKYAQQYAAGSNAVVLAPDVAEIFPDSESVNEAIRAIASVARRQQAKRSA